MPPLAAIAHAIPIAAPPSTAPVPHIPVATDLMALLTDPTLTPSTTPASMPLMLSPSLPPIPAKLVAKVQAGTFVAMKEFLADNVALSQRLDELQPSPGAATPWFNRASTARMREINSPSQWALCWLMFASIQCRDPKLRATLAHGCIVLQLAQRHGGTGWLEYDRIFRRQAASDPTIAWNTLNPSLMAATVLATSPGTGTICPHCQAADHGGEDCALLSVDPFLDNQTRIHRPPTTPQQQLRTQKARYTPYGNPGSSSEPCRRFNRGVCPDTATTCRYKHVCGNPECLASGHTATNCPRSRRPTGPPPTKPN